MQLQSGTYLQGDKYRIIRTLGNGGFGITYLAEHELAGRMVCIKEFFPKEYYNRDEDSRNVSLGSNGSAEMMSRFKEKFIKEAKTIARLDHPNIIRILDVFVENNTAYYVMEYIEGESLSDVVKRCGTLAEGDAVKYIRAVASALDYIHERRIMHLDIKPANVMLREEDDRVILIDFGLSKQYDAEGNQTSSTPLGISAGYAPMEQYQQGGVKEFSPETDIYSLGATLYTLVTGSVPPQSAIIVDEGLPELPAYLSESVRNAIERSMEVQRRRRPHSVKEFLALLGSDDKDEVVPPKPPVTSADEDTIIPPQPKVQPEVEQRSEEQSNPVPPTPSTPKKSSNWWLWLLGLLLVCGSAYFLLNANRDIKELSVDETPTIAINGHEAVDMGLSVKWATCNVGATSPEDYGDYFAWGETSPKTSYTYDTSKTYGKSMGDIGGDSRYDAATANWGSGWRLPTEKEFDELITQCTWTWIKRNGVNGYEVKSKKNGNCIFLPAAGYCYGDAPSNQGSYGSYWSSTPNDTGYAFSLSFNSDDRSTDWDDRFSGLSVRPVSE